jgi:hypothetical protein
MKILFNGYETEGLGFMIHLSAFFFMLFEVYFGSWANYLQKKKILVKRTFSFAFTNKRDDIK